MCSCMVHGLELIPCTPAGLPPAVSAAHEPLPRGENGQTLCQRGGAANVSEGLLARP